LRILVVAASDGGSAHPELADVPIAETAAVRVEGADLVGGERAAAAHEFDGIVHLEPRAGD
jgi:hypothetical protein